MPSPATMKVHFGTVFLAFDHLALLAKAADTVVHQHKTPLQFFVHLPFPPFFCLPYCTSDGCSTSY